MARVLKEVIRLVAEHAIQPVKPIQVFSFGEIEQAFRMMQNGKAYRKGGSEAYPEDQVNVGATFHS